MGITGITIVTYLLVLFALYVFLKYNDEWIALIVFFFISSGLNRYNVVMDKKASWVRVAYSRGVDFFKMTDELGLEALNLFLFGTTMLSISYFYFSVQLKNVKVKKKDTPQQLNAYLNIHQPTIIFGFIGIFVVNTVTKAFGSLLSGAGSYLMLFGMALGGMIVLIYITIQSLSLRQNFFSKILLTVIMLFAIVNSYDPYLRFQFLSWAIAAGIVFLKNKSITQKLMYYVVGGSAIIIVFAIAGVSRSQNLSKLSVSEIMDKALARSSNAEDSNMLDGFMMTLQVYPQHLNYQYGMQHLEILMRPIPRALWPDKPPGGYANKLGLNDNMQGNYVGISESLYGTFYGEGAIIGIILFCILYGYLFAKAFQYADRYSSDIKYLLKGVILASTIPLMRGGDLPGIIAFVGMSYWPIFLLLRGYTNYINAENLRKKRINSRLAHQAKLMQQNQNLTKTDATI
ncbi:hypothetical protein SAMN05421780_106215 [Flexibacter flexilis DSM 6793]|uniref:Oligosaccharide repeat unit polymerase n=1 Tax=Flexibacter flexilis DSM 6793 TaxID=927664 RepID=A0A1I1KBB7_9BACT|nr:hypothetical protein [Flexibacter flexilis]SFC54840.1 hypothetical protein SAMN05421780_106215 [Flexibacter flexilis DSM 6793]